MGICPSYRLRLFMSVDLVGSTEFKTGEGKDRGNTTDPHPRWVQETKRFYVSFPKFLQSHFRDKSPRFGIIENESAPKLWKTIGDEVVFCVRVHNLEHFTACVTSFIRALRDYGRQLENDGFLDVKGTIWVGAFPAPNTSVMISGCDSNSGYNTKIDENYCEEYEQAADDEPRNFDFLGRDIDLGFRIAKHARAEDLALSCEAAFLLCEANKAHQFHEKFNFNGRDVLKGVMRGKPYPVVTIDTERNNLKSEIADLESNLSGGGGANVNVNSLSRFLTLLFGVEKIAFPVLPKRGHAIEAMPSDYNEFVGLWQEEQFEITSREEGEDRSATENSPPAQEGKTIDEQVNELSANIQPIGETEDD